MIVDASTMLYWNVIFVSSYKGINIVNTAHWYHVNYSTVNQKYLNFAIKPIALSITCTLVNHVLQMELFITCWFPVEVTMSMVIHLLKLSHTIRNHLFSVGPVLQRCNFCQAFHLCVWRWFNSIVDIYIASLTWFHNTLCKSVSVDIACCHYYMNHPNVNHFIEMISHALFYLF